jgi:hypothetical protein
MRLPQSSILIGRPRQPPGPAFVPGRAPWPTLRSEPRLRGMQGPAGALATALKAASAGRQRRCVDDRAALLERGRSGHARDDDACLARDRFRTKRSRASPAPMRTPVIPMVPLGGTRAIPARSRRRRPTGPVGSVSWTKAVAGIRCGRANARTSRWPLRFRVVCLSEEEADVSAPGPGRGGLRALEPVAMLGRDRRSD